MTRTTICILALLGIATLTAYAKPASLTFEPAGNETYTFDTGTLRGTLRNEGRSIGLLSFEHVPTATRLDGNNYGIFSHYRVFTANKRYGHGAWDWPSTSKRRSDGTVEVHWPATEDRPFDMGAVYRWSAPDTLDLVTSVTAHADLTAFESFLASYFTKAFPASTVYAKGGSEDRSAFQTTEQDRGHWQAFPRDRQAVALIQDGRWQQEPSPVDWTIRNDLALPLAIRRNQENGVCAILMAPPEDCFAVMTPYADEGHRSLYLSLFGRDIKAGETATARARLVVRPLAKDEEAVALYKSYIEEQHRPR